MLSRPSVKAESVSRALGVPVLLHPAPKPGCAGDVVRFFLGEMPLRTVGLGTLAQLGKTDGWDVVVRQEGMVMVDAEIVGEEVREGTLLGRPSMLSTRRPSTALQTPAPSPEPDTRPIVHRTPLDHPKILVIGDRLATDVLLARRLGAYYPRTTRAGEQTEQVETKLSDRLPALSIITTQLFKPSDLRLLRWLEESWLRLGLALRARFRFAQKTPNTNTQESLQRWVLSRSIDAPPEVERVMKTKPASLAEPVGNLRARMTSWTSPPAWKYWAVGLVPSRARVWFVLKTGVRRVGRGLGRLVRRLRPTTA